jgi:glycosyltransferase involved in cell wall biosynthesis
VGGIPEVVEDGTTGVLLASGDAAALAEAVSELISNSAHRAALGQAGRETARRRFCADVIVPKYEAVYRRVARGG